MDFKMWLEDKKHTTSVDVFSEVFTILSKIPCEKEFAQIVKLVKSSENKNEATLEAARAAYEEMLASLRKSL